MRSVGVQNRAARARMRRKAATFPTSPPVTLERVPVPPKRAPASRNRNTRWRGRRRKRASSKHPSRPLLTGTATTHLSPRLFALHFSSQEVCRLQMFACFFSRRLSLTWLIRQLRVCERRQRRSQQQCDQRFAAPISAGLHLFATSAIFIIVLTAHLLASLPFAPVLTCLLNTVVLSNLDCLMGEK